MDESTRQLEHALAAERRELGRNLDELESKAKALKDWRTYYRQRPWMVMGAVFGGGLLLGLMSYKPAAARTVPLYGDEDTDARARSTGLRIAPQVAASVDRVKRQAGDTWDHIAEALMGVAAAKAIDFVSQKIPGFSEEYSRRHPDSFGRRVG